MGDENELVYWKTKYSLLEEQYAQQKKRNEDLEERLLDMVEKIETDKLALSSEIDDLTRRLERANKIIIKYNSGNLSQTVTKPDDLSLEDSSPHHSNDTPDDPVIFERHKSSFVMLTGPTSPKSDKTYQHFPILAHDEGFIYGFRWTKENVVKVV